MAFRYGTMRDDFMWATGRDDHFIGLGGNDRMYGRGGNDQLYGYNGDDLIKGDNGDDHVSGGNGNDTLDGGSGYDWIYGGNGNDTAWGRGGNDFMDGGAGNDRFWGHNGHDTIYGGEGNDHVSGGNGNDHVHGGAGDDEVFGGNGHDILDGGTGSNVIGGGSGHDTVLFDFGVVNARDFMFDTNFVDGGAGTDTVKITNEMFYPNSNAEFGGPETFACYTLIRGDGHPLLEEPGNMTIEVGNSEDELDDTVGLGMTVTGIERIEVACDAERPVYYDGSLHRADDLTLWTGSGNDILNAGIGNETFRTGDGNNSIDLMNHASVDTVEIGYGTAGSTTVRGFGAEDEIAFLNFEDFDAPKPSWNQSGNDMVAEWDGGSLTLIDAGDWFIG